MRITERRLRQLIRSVIKEAKINEMMGDMHHFDALSGAAAHGGSKNPLYTMVYPEDVYGSDPSKHPAFTDAANAVGMSGNLVGMLAMYYGLIHGSMDSFITGAGIAAGSALYMLIKNYLDSGNLLGQQQVEDERDRRELMAAKAQLESQRQELEKAKRKLEDEGFDK